MSFTNNDTIKKLENIIPDNYGFFFVKTFAKLFIYFYLMIEYILHLIE